MSFSSMLSLQTHTLRQSENKKNRDSSQNITVIQNAKGLSAIYRAQSFLRIVLAGRWFGFLFAALP